MKILSTNIRGLGSRVKKREVRDLIRSQKVDFVCIQESKLEIVDDLICQSVWGDGQIGWATREASGRSGGIISIWNSEVFSCLSSWHMAGALIVNGLWGAERVLCWV